MTRADAGKTYNPNIHSIDRGDVYLLSSGNLVLVDYRNGSVVGIVYSNGTETSWSHSPSAQRFLTFNKAKLVTHLTMPLPQKSRLSKVLMMAQAVAETVFEKRRAEHGIAVPA